MEGGGGAGREEGGGGRGGHKGRNMHLLTRVLEVTGYQPHTLEMVGGVNLTLETS